MKLLGPKQVLRLAQLWQIQGDGQEEACSRGSAQVKKHT